MKLTRQQRLGLLLTGILLALLALLFALTGAPRAVEPEAVAGPHPVEVSKPEKKKQPRRASKKRTGACPAPEPRNPIDEEF